jgi:hypothetical protein
VFLDGAGDFRLLPDESEKEKAAAEAATVWLALVDAGQYDESWFQAASVFRNAVSKEQWTNTMRSGRAPLGNMGTRHLKSATFTTKLENMWSCNSKPASRSPRNDRDANPDAR